MSAVEIEEGIHTIRVERVLEIAASAEIVFQSVLDELGPEGEMPDGTPFPMVIEPHVGGRWYRDLGDGAGHFWGCVQVIKPPTLLELCGPMFMSYPAVSHVQYRLAASGSGTTLRLTHRAFGQIPADHREGVHTGWEHGLARVKAIAEQRASR